MAKGDYLSSYQKKVVRRYYEHRDTSTLQTLTELVSDLYLAQGKQAERLWERAAMLLVKTQVNPGRMQKVLQEKDVAGLAELVGELSGKKEVRRQGPTETPPVPAPAAATPPPMAEEPDEETLKAAYKAFKKRIKVTKLDNASGLTRSPLSGGDKREQLAIQPPREYPPAVWEALVRQGRLKHTGGGFYALP